MCSCPGPARRPGCMRWSAPSPTALGSWTCPIGSSPMAICSWPRPYRELVARRWRSTSSAAPISSCSRQGNCALSGTGCAASSTRLPATAAASWPGPPPTASRPSRPWPPTSSPPAACRTACFAGGADHDQLAQMQGGLAVATQQANRAHDRERELRQHQQRRDGWLEANAHLGPQYRQVVRTLAWQRRATGLAVEQDRPGYVLEALGPVPASTRGRRAWRQVASQIEDYRHTYHIADPERALGSEPRDPAQRADRQRVRTAIQRVQAKQRRTDPIRDLQPTAERTTQHRPQQRRSRPGPERAAG